VSGGDGARPAYVTVRVAGSGGGADYDLHVGTTEVTQRAWEDLMGVAPAIPRTCADCPVQLVSWYDAATYANALSEREGLTACYALADCEAKEWGDAESPPEGGVAGRVGLACAQASVAAPGCNGYRLPTRAEWDTFGPVAEVSEGRRAAREYAAFRRVTASEPRPVASGRPNEHGVYDTIGNVEEWLETRAAVPQDQTRWQREEPLQVWFFSAGNCFHARYRHLELPSPHHQLGSWGRSCLGFRLVRTLTSPAE